MCDKCNNKHLRVNVPEAVLQWVRIIELPLSIDVHPLQTTECIVSPCFNCQRSVPFPLAQAEDVLKSTNEFSCPSAKLKPFVLACRDCAKLIRDQNHHGQDERIQVHSRPKPAAAAATTNSFN